MFNQSTDAVAQWGAGIPGFAASLAAMTNGQFIMAAGGWPIRVNGITIGGIGVSGGNAPGRDDEIACAGLAVVEALSAPIPTQPAQVAVRAGYEQNSASLAGNNDRVSRPQDLPPMTQHLPVDNNDPYSAFGMPTSSQSNENRSGDQL